MSNLDDKYAVLLRKHSDQIHQELVRQKENQRIGSNNGLVVNTQFTSWAGVPAFVVAVIAFVVMDDNHVPGWSMALVMTAFIGLFVCIYHMGQLVKQYVLNLEFEQRRVPVIQKEWRRIKNIYLHAFEDGKDLGIDFESKQEINDLFDYAAEMADSYIHFIYK